MDLVIDILAVIGAITLLVLLGLAVLFSPFFGRKEKDVLAELQNEFELLKGSDETGHVDWKFFVRKLQKEESSLPRSEVLKLIEDASFEYGQTYGRFWTQRETREEILQSLTEADIPLDVLRKLLSGANPLVSGELGTQGNINYQKLLLAEIEKVLEGEPPVDIDYVLQLRRDWFSIVSSPRDFPKAIRDVRMKLNLAVLSVPEPNENLLIIDDFTEDEYQGLFDAAADGDVASGKMLGFLWDRPSPSFKAYILDTARDEWLSRDLPKDGVSLAEYLVEETK